MGFFKTTAPYRLYRNFAEYRKDPKKFNRKSNLKVRYTIAATIGAITGSTENPVGEATFWKGGKTALFRYQKNARFQEKHLKEHPSPDPINIDPEILEKGSEWEMLETLFPKIPNHPHFGSSFVYKETGSGKHIHRHAFFTLTAEGKKHYYPLKKSSK